MVAAGPRIHPSLVRELVRLDDGRASIADVCRGLGDLADRRGLTRPSYEAVRTLVHLARTIRRQREQSAGTGFVRELARQRTDWAVTEALVLAAVDMLAPHRADDAVAGEISRRRAGA